MCSHSLKTLFQHRVEKAGSGVLLCLSLMLLMPHSLLHSADKAASPVGVLRVCADPNNLPFTNERLEGFENRIAELIARELNARVEYTWWAQRRGFIRNTLKQGNCDLVTGVPSDYEMVLPTKPYYRSSYVFVYRRSRGISVQSLDDPVLRSLKIGVQIIGDDYFNTPPAHALANRHIVSNVVGYTVYGDYSQESPPSRIIDAVADGTIDLAIAWGPMAGFFAERRKGSLKIVPVSPRSDGPALPFVYDIALGVRKGDTKLKLQIDGILERNRDRITKILSDYGVPLVNQ